MLRLVSLCVLALFSGITGCDDAESARIQDMGAGMTLDMTADMTRDMAQSVDLTMPPPD